MQTIKNSHELQDRLKNFALQVLQLIKTLPRTEENRIYGKQVIRSSSSIGANYAEALYAHSKQDFLHGVNLSRKETNETLYWLSLIHEANPLFQLRMTQLLDENKQILKIFISTIKTAKKQSTNGK